MLAFSGCAGVSDVSDEENGEKISADQETIEDETEITTGSETTVYETDVSDDSDDADTKEDAETDTGVTDTDDSNKKEQESFYGQEYVDAALELNVTTLDGEVIPIKDLIKDKKVVMLNEWGTFCGPCINEMPGLGELAREYKDQGFEIIGLTVDLVDYDGNIQQSAVQDAKDIIDDTGVTYPVVSMPLEMIDYLNTGYVPTTIFVDGNGRMLEEVMISSKEKSDWEIIIKELLANAE